MVLKGLVGNCFWRHGVDEFSDDIIPFLDHRTYVGFVGHKGEIIAIEKIFINPIGNKDVF